MRLRRKYRTLGLAGLLAVMAMVVVASVGAAAASAAEPEFVQWFTCKSAPGGVGEFETQETCKAGTPEIEGGAWKRFGKTFVSAGGEKILKIEGAPESEWIKCETVENTGELTGSQTDKVTITFKKCKTFFGLVTCTSTGAASGTIVTKDLNSRLVYINHTTKEVGLDLSPVTGNFTEEITCSSVKILVRGSVIGKITPTNTITTKFSLAFEVEAGKQKPSEYEKEEPAGSGTWVKVSDTLECSTNGGTSWKPCTEQEVTPDTITVSEAGEIKA